MSYKSLVDEYQELGYMKKIAGSIKQRMSEQRQGANPNDARRWIWELFQNGKDVRHPSIPFKIEVNLNTNAQPSKLEFKHNGQPFSVKHITYLVEQVSSKEQEFEEDGMPTNTGKFGSGFLTTHLLSEKVMVDTVIKAEGLNYKKCIVELDRSPRQEAEIIRSIKDSLSVLQKLDDTPDLNSFDPTAFNTSFIYDLDTDGIKVAETGLNDLRNTIPYVLAFVQSISHVNIASEAVEYSLNLDLTKNEDDIYDYTIRKSDIFEDEDFEVFVVKGAKVEIAIPIKRINNQIFVQPIPEQLPRLFCDFPLIGTELFPFPSIINSPLFNLNDPRSIVRLTDVNEPEINENKQLIIEATSLFLSLLKFLEKNDAQNCFNLTKNINDVSLDWISDIWYKKNVLHPIHQALSKTEIVDTQLEARRAVLNENSKPFVLFPYHMRSNIRDEIFNLAEQWFPYALPRKSDIHHWAGALFPQCTRLTVKLMAEYITNQKDIKNLQQRLNDIDAIEWLNRFYFLLNEEEVFLKDVVANEIKVLPDQNGEFKLMKDLFFGGGIDEVYKDMLKELGYDLRSELREDEIITNVNIKPNAKFKILHFERKLEEVYQKLNQLLKSASTESAIKVAKKLGATFASTSETPAYREKLFAIMQRIYSNEKFNRFTISKYDVRVYEESDTILLKQIILDISKRGSLKQLQLDLSLPSTDETRNWLKSFIELLIEMKKDAYLQITQSPILPNENGDFRVKEALSFGITDETLKDVAVKLGYDFREHLIDNGMPVAFDASREITNKDIAEKILALIGSLMADMQQDTTTKEAFLQLFNWFSKHNNLAEELFGDLYHNRHRLCAPEDIVSSLQKAATLDQIMKENGLENVDQLRDRLQQETANCNGSELTEVTRDILLSLGVKNYEEFKTALADTDLAKLFDHQSVPSAEYFMFVQSIIERTRIRIKEFLEGEGYDFSRADLSATTVFTGVIKNGNFIDIVFRPSDNNEVIFYYGSEKQTLENPLSELWVADKTGVPEQITMGRVLIVNNITKVRIN